MTAPRLTSPLATGRTAEVFAWGDGRVLKLFREGWGEAHARREFDVAQRLHALGVAAPQAFEVVVEGGRHGVVYERIDGPSMLGGLTARPWQYRSAARALAGLHAAMHEKDGAGLRSQREKLVRDVQRGDGLNEVEKQAVSALLESLPDGDRLCHGDFHPDNVLLSPRGPVIIDWPDASTGNPLADVARSVVLARFGQPLGAPLLKRAAISLLGRLFARAYLGRYFALTRGNRRDIELWLTVIAAARIAEGVENEHDRLVAFVRRRLRTGRHSLSF